MNNRYKIPAHLTNPITGNTIYFDYAKIIEADEEPINEKIVKEYKEKMKEFDDIAIKELGEIPQVAKDYINLTYGDPEFNRKFNELFNRKSNEFYHKASGEEK